MQLPYTLFPEISAYQTDTLLTEDHHQIYYEICGNPNGFPVVFLHGGPGSGCNPAQRRFFDPAFYKIILIDQRGCGRSLPLGGTINNTTAHLIADIDAIRTTLEIEKWLVFGGSWGSTLAINYALAFPQHVAGLILRGIFLSRPSELNWFLGDISHFYPDVWHTLTHFLPENARHDVLTAFSQLIFDEDPIINVPAAYAWNAFESAIMRLIPNETKPANNQSDNNKTLSAGDNKVLDHENAMEVARARIQIHYIQHQCFIDGEAVLQQCTALNTIPTVIVQGRYDMVCPPKTAWDLSRVMPHAEFHIVADAGHSAMETGVISALVAATEQFKKLNS
jgi:proline iminopeptidase